MIVLVDDEVNVLNGVKLDISCVACVFTCDVDGKLDSEGESWVAGCVNVTDAVVNVVMKGVKLDISSDACVVTCDISVVIEFFILVVSGFIVEIGQIFLAGYDPCAKHQILIGSPSFP